MQLYDLRSGVAALVSSFVDARARGGKIPYAAAVIGLKRAALMLERRIGRTRRGENRTGSAGDWGVRRRLDGARATTGFRLSPE
jgi:hypothetical protein